ncbi:MAG: hypothetical protein AB7G17_12555 [Phycisphaerales bacterium]
MSVPRIASMLRQAIEVHIDPATSPPLNPTSPHTTPTDVVINIDRTPGDGAPQSHDPITLTRDDALALRDALSALESAARPNGPTEQALREALQSEAGRQGLIAAIVWESEQRMMTREENRERHFNRLLTIGGIGVTAVLALMTVGTAAVGYFGRTFIEKTLAADLRANQHLLTSEIAAARISLKETITADVTANLARDLDDRVASQLSQSFADEQAYQQLSVLALGLDIKTSFSEDEANAVIALLAALRDKPAFHRRAEFPVLLERVLDSFAGARNDSRVDVIFDSYQPLCLASRDVTITLLEHYGKRLAGSLEPAAQWSPAVLQRFDTVADSLAASQSQSQRIAAVSAFRVIVEYRKNDEQRSTYGENLWRAVREMDPGNDPQREGSDPRILFARTLLSMTDPAFLVTIEQAPPATRQQVRVASALLQDYASEFGAILDDLGETGQREVVVGLARTLLNGNRKRPKPLSDTQIQAIIISMQSQMAAAISAYNTPTS